MLTYETRKKFDRRILCVLKDGLPMTQIEIARLINQISDDDICLLAKGQPKEVKGYCEVKKHSVGAGTCLAHKYEKYGVKRDVKCDACKSQSITEQLNYIFKSKYGEKYHAEWRDKHIKVRSFIE
jgi:hypothetical protein